MAMTVKRRKDTKRPSVFLKKIADIPGGVCISTQGLEGVDFLPEGTPITRPINGICYVIKHGGVVGYSALIISCVLMAISTTFRRVI